MDQKRCEFIKENNKVRKQELNKESDQEHKNSTKKATKKKRKKLTFLGDFLFSCFLTFLFSLKTSHLRKSYLANLKHQKYNF